MMDSFHLKRYSTETFLKTILGIILLGTLGVLGLQRFINIPAWIQYLVLTAVIANAYFVGSNLCAIPARITLGDTGIKVTQGRLRTREYLWENIKSFARYQELLLNSLKIRSQDGETISLICFKWEDPTHFHDFLAAFENRLETVGNQTEDSVISRSGTLYTSWLKVIITIFLLVCYICVVILLVSKNAFTAWNPVWVYYFWVVPIAFFIKMWAAR